MRNPQQWSRRKRYSSCFSHQASHDQRQHLASSGTSPLCVCTHLSFERFPIYYDLLTLSTSFAENNTAILVGCMPAFAKFVKFVGSSIASRRSRSNQNLVQGSDNSFKHEAWQIQMPPPLPHSNGRAGSVSRNDSLEYYESTETILLQTQVSIAGYGQQYPQHPKQDWETGITRTTDIHQQEVWAANHIQFVEHAV